MSLSFFNVSNKYDGRLVPQPFNVTLADAALVYDNVQVVDVRLDEPVAWLVSVQLNPMSIAELGPSLVTKLGRGANVSVTDGNPESTPLDVAIQVTWGIDNIQHTVVVDIGRGVTIPVYGKYVGVKGVGRQVITSASTWPNALLVSAAPDCSARGYRALRRTVSLATIAAGAQSADFAIPPWATRGELSVTNEMLGGQLVVTQTDKTGGNLKSSWVFPPTAGASGLIPDQSFPVDPRASVFSIRNDGPVITPNIAIAFDLAL